MQSHNYPVNVWSRIEDQAPSVALPSELTFHAFPKPEHVDIHKIFVVPSSSNAAVEGQFVTIPLPHQGLIAPKSMFLHGKLVITATGNVAAGALNLPIGVSSVIRRLSTSIGSTSVDTITSYPYVIRMLQVGGYTKAYCEGDGAVLERIGWTNAALVANDRVELDFAIPLLCSMNLYEKAWPLFAFATPLNFNLEMNSVAGTLGSATNVTYSLTNIRLHYTQMLPNEDYVTVFRHLMSKRFLQLPLNLFQEVSVSAGAGSDYSYNAGISCSSMNGILWGIFGANSNNYLLLKNGHTRTRVNVDGVLTPNYEIDTDSVSFAMASEVFGGVNSITSVGLVDPNNFTTECYLRGLSLQRVNDSNLRSTGRDVKQGVQFVIAGNTAASTLHIVFVLEKTLIVDGYGVPAIVN